MSVKVIRKQSGQANEVTAAMQAAAYEVLNKSVNPISIYRAMEAARIAEVGEIERIDIHNNENTTFFEVDGDTVIIDTDSWISKENLIPLAEALLELGKQMKGAV